MTVESRYFRRRWDEVRGDEFDGWGHSVWYFEIDDGGYPIRQIVDTGQGRKTDPVDAHSVAVAGLRSPGLRTVAADDLIVVLRLLVDRRDELGGARTETDTEIERSGSDCGATREWCAYRRPNGRPTMRRISGEPRPAGSLTLSTGLRVVAGAHMRSVTSRVASM